MPPMWAGGGLPRGSLVAPPLLPLYKKAAADEDVDEEGDPERT